MVNNLRQLQVSAVLFSLVTGKSFHGNPVPANLVLSDS
jgi:hypothetical protein